MPVSPFFHFSFHQRVIRKKQTPSPEVSKKQKEKTTGLFLV